MKPAHDPEHEQKEILIAMVTKEINEMRINRMKQYAKDILRDIEQNDVHQHFFTGLARPGGCISTDEIYENVFYELYQKYNEAYNKPTTSKLTAEFCLHAIEYLKFLCPKVGETFDY